MSTSAPYASLPLRPWLVRWLLAGVILIICVPAARGSSLLIGWLPYWLVLAPLICLGIIERSALRARWAQQWRGHRRARRGNRRVPKRTRAALGLAALVSGWRVPGV